MSRLETFPCELYFRVRKLHRLDLSVDVAEPPITKSFSSEAIEDKIDSKSKLEESVVCFPCHTQAVERAVKLGTEAATKVAGYENTVRLLW